jgi:hypothetical protein
MNNRNNVDSDNLVFDESKIVNKNTDYSYALDLDDSEKIMGNNGNQYYFIQNYYEDIDGKTGSDTYNLPGNYKNGISGIVFFGGPGMDSFFAVMINEDDTISYFNYEKVVYDNDYTVQTIPSITNAKKLYNAKTTYLYYTGEENEVSADGETILVQVADGSIIDLYDYLME